MKAPPDLADPAMAHARRMNRVLDHIDRHLAEDLKLEQLARIAAYSPFHFPRLLLARTGETPNELVRRRRLEAAGSHLRHAADESVAEVAATVGFASVEAFARAFKQQFGMTPTEWRKGGYRDWEARQRALIPEKEAPPPAVQLRQEAECELLYWRHTGPYDGALVELWRRFLPWVEALGLDKQPLLGMGLDDPSITPAAHCRYDACVVLPKGWQGAATRCSRRTLRGGWFACLDFKGSRQDIGAEWNRILRHWLPGSGFTLADCPFIEYYSPEHRPIDDDHVQLRVPVES